MIAFAGSIAPELDTHFAWSEQDGASRIALYVGI